jgi:hypothetical protein
MVSFFCRCERHQHPTEPTNMKNKIESIITILPTFNQRMAAEAVLELLIEGVISEREAKRQLAVNGINI